MFGLVVEEGEFFGDLLLGVVGGGGGFGYLCIIVFVLLGCEWVWCYG